MRRDLIAFKTNRVKVIEPSLLSKINADFTVTELRLYSYALSKLYAKGMQKQIDSLEKASILSNIAVEIPISDYKEFTEKTGKEAYEDIVRISETMFHRFFEIDISEIKVDLGIKAKRGKALLRAIRFVVYDAASGNIEIKFTPEFVYLYSQLGAGGLAYYSYELENIRKLGTSYAILLFRYISSSLYKGCRLKVLVNSEEGKDSLDRILGISTKYPKYADKKRAVLVPALNEINEKTILAVGFREIKEGRRVKWIEFEVMRKDGGPKVLG